MDPQDVTIRAATIWGGPDGVQGLVRDAIKDKIRKSGVSAMEFNKIPGMDIDYMDIFSRGFKFNERQALRLMGVLGVTLDDVLPEKDIDEFDDERYTELMALVLPEETAGLGAGGEEGESDTENESTNQQFDLDLLFRMQLRQLALASLTPPVATAA